MRFLVSVSNVVTIKSQSQYQYQIMNLYSLRAHPFALFEFSEHLGSEANAHAFSIKFKKSGLVQVCFPPHILSGGHRSPIIHTGSLFRLPPVNNLFTEPKKQQLGRY